MKLKIKTPNLSEYQTSIVDSPKRFTITEGSTKIGKTFSHIWWLFREAHGPTALHGRNYWWVAPVYSQAKIAFNRIVARIRNNTLYHVNLASLEITTPLGTILQFKSAQDPNSLYGEDVYAVVIDEGSRMKEDAWFAIRSTLVATGGHAKLIGNVQGVDNWYYRLARKAEAGELDNWAYFKVTADDAIKAGILSQAEVDDAENTYPRGIFLELFYAIPFANSSNKFAFAFMEEKHIGKTSYNDTHPLYVSFDFNRNPICATLFQHYDEKIFGIECIKLLNSNIYHLCREIKNKYPTAMIIVNGDATGKASAALVRDNLNYYRIIKTELDISEQVIKVPSINPPIADNQVLVNAILEHYPMILDKDKCQGLIHDLKFVEMLPDGSIKKGDREDPNQQADALDTFRYYLNMNFKWFIKRALESKAA